MFRILFVYLLLYVPYMQNLKDLEMHVWNATAGAKLGYNGTFARTKLGYNGTFARTSFVNLIYSTIVCNDASLS